MLSKIEAGKNNGDDSGNGRLLHEIEAISKALYLDKTGPKGLVSAAHGRSLSTRKTHLPEPKSKPKNANEDSSDKDKKSFWNWKPLKALSHIRNRKFNCCFSLLVHTIEGLPPSFNDNSLCVHWKRRDGELRTRLAKVFDGVAEFEEKLNHICSVYGSRSGSQNSAKYEAKYFLLYVSVSEAPELDLGKHRVDLTRLLPLTLEELDDEKNSGKWTTSFKLSGKAKGAVINVSFGYTVLGGNHISPQSKSTPEALKHKNLNSVKSMNRAGHSDGRSVVHQIQSISSSPLQQSKSTSRSIEDIKVLHEVLPVAKSDLSNSINLVCQKFDEDKQVTSVDYKPEVSPSSELLESSKLNSHYLPGSDKGNVENESEDNEFLVIEHGVELESKEVVKVESNELEPMEVVKVVPKESEPKELVILDEDALKDADNSVDKTAVGPSVGEQIVPQTQAAAYGRKQEEPAEVYCDSEEDTYATKSIIEELESALNCASILEKAASDSPEDKSELADNENYVDVEADHGMSSKGKSFNLDDATDSVASEFLKMLGIEHSPLGFSSDSDPESPRERLLREFEKEALAYGHSLFDFGANDVDQPDWDYDAPSCSNRDYLYEDYDLALGIPPAAEEVDLTAKVATTGKNRAIVLEDLETEALMQEWGLNERAFQASPPNSAGGFGSPIDLPPEEPFELPPLGDGLGPCLKTKSGGFLRSMNPSPFKSAKSGGSLVMQVSCPVVVPAEMGSGVMEILQRLASVGIEKLSMQAKKLMPLEDVTGKTMEQVAWEAASDLDEFERQGFLQHQSEVGQELMAAQKKVKGKSSQLKLNDFSRSSMTNDMASECVSLEDLAPLAMDKIEALSIEGLRIQSGMSDEEAPSNISSQSIGDISALEGKRVHTSGSLGLEGAGGLQLLDIKDSGEEVDGLMGLSLTLDEWMRLDSGEFDDEDQTSERTSKVLAAHHANCGDLVWSRGEKRRGKSSGRRCGLLSNNFTVALMVQLRDPLRNYETVGAPMLALIQVERVFVPPKPRIYSTVSELRNNIEDDDDSEPIKKEEMKGDIEVKAIEEEGIPQFKITEVHVAGLKTEPEPGKKKLWGSSSQQQSGSRWLLANGMGKTNKHPFMKSKAVGKSSTASAPATATVQPGDTLWSISSRVHGTGAKWKELAALNPHIRNPNVIFPNEKIRLR
ncbi:NT-type C2 domain [Dillenia turbinata]|uniref:NT-type C2 domain n=1 Tax=Dillenia turbinata TaxID=194707 RepID=A0AAN8ZKY6_9MAGN